MPIVLLRVSHMDPMSTNQAASMVIIRPARQQRMKYARCPPAATHSALVRRQRECARASASRMGSAAGPVIWIGRVVRRTYLARFARDG